MSVSRPVLALAGAAIAGIALVGVGAGATFTDATSSSQQITAGSLNVVVSSPDVAGCRTAAAGCKSLTLAAVGPVSSTFETPATHVTITNNSDIPAHFAAIQISTPGTEAGADLALKNEMNICIRSTDDSGTWVEGNGPLTTAVGLTPSVKQNDVVLAPGQTAEYWMDFYAGQNSECGTVTSDGPSTTASWNGYQGHPYQTPASLTDAAQGGSVTTTLTFAYTG